MKKFTLGFFAILCMSLLTSCEAVNTIFKAGMWWAFILIFGGVALVIWIISKFMGGNKK
ncbi:phosphatidate cytidylyltransferase [Soonwooa sp.]|uniref:phosphatidate cytidylyltransferase n=1 Tax=Soonwooa sp. TaxID=1938592 RepID=UPI002897B2F0|nr:phosphatidate cytidylyltransferase [Soonwooa sp.]